MILLQPDCLVFRTSDGDNIPCSAQQVTIELIGDSAAWLDDEIIQDAAQAVLHYFKSELGQTLVSVGEFAQALERVLRGFGYDVRTPEQGEAISSAQEQKSNLATTSKVGKVATADLCRLVQESGDAFELEFFPRLREALQLQLKSQPAVVRFHGLRSCVKQLTGAQRWTARCRRLEDQIVGFVRECLSNEPGSESCPVIVE